MRAKKIVNQSSDFPVRHTGSYRHKKALVKTIYVHKLWKKWKECNDDTAYDKYRKQANKASKAVKWAKREFERKIGKTSKQIQNLFMLTQDPRAELRI